MRGSRQSSWRSPGALTRMPIQQRTWSLAARPAEAGPTKSIPVYRKQLTDLLKADLGLTTRHDSADTLALDSAALRQHTIGDPQLLKQLRRQVRSADAGGVRDRLGFQKRSPQRIDRTDVWFRRATSNRHADRRTREVDASAGTDAPRLINCSRSPSATITTSMASPRSSRAGMDVEPVPIDVASVTIRWPVERSNSRASSRYAAVKAPDVMTLISSAATASRVSSRTAMIAVAAPRRAHPRNHSKPLVIGRSRAPSATVILIAGSAHLAEAASKPEVADGESPARTQMPTSREPVRKRPAPSARAPQAARQP